MTDDRYPLIDESGVCDECGGPVMIVEAEGDKEYTCPECGHGMTWSAT